MRILLIDETCAPIAVKQQGFPPEEADAVQLEVKKLVDRGIVCTSNRSWGARCAMVRKTDVTLRLYQDYRTLNRCMRTESVGLGNIQEMFQRLDGDSSFTSIDLASRLFPLPIVGKDRHKTAFRDAFGQLAAVGVCAVRVWLEDTATVIREHG